MIRAAKRHPVASSSHREGVAPHKLKAPDRIATKPGLPPAAQAVSIALAVLRQAKVGTWAELAAQPTLPEGLELTEEQYQLLCEHVDLLGVIRFGIPGSEKPYDTTITLLVCPDCGGWTRWSSGSGLSSCESRLECPGKPVKAAVASKVTAKTAATKKAEEGAKAAEGVDGESVPASNGTGSR